MSVKSFQSTRENPNAWVPLCDTKAGGGSASGTRLRRKAHEVTACIHDPSLDASDGSYLDLLTPAVRARLENREGE